MATLKGLDGMPQGHHPFQQYEMKIWLLQEVPL
jgi:hypothetical protein